jgi:hypothetical protein
MQLYGQTWTRRQLEARVGRLEQIAGIRHFRLTEGPEEGVEQIQVRTGAGLTYYVTPQHGLDISLAEFGGVPISWQSVNGDVHPAYYDPTGLEWLRTAAGGLLMTCGLTQVGSPCQDDGKALGQHGRAHHLAARQVVAEGHWQGDDYELHVGGMIEETMIFGEHVRLTRQIRSWLGQNRIVIDDVVENVGFMPVPHMLLYHFNFGFPLVSEAARFTFPSRRVVPREPGTPMEGYDRYQAPTAGYRERVYYHEELVTKNGKATALIETPHFPQAQGTAPRPLTMRLTWSAGTLPYLTEWKMPGENVYVLGIEPGNCHVEGRVAERQRGTLVMLEPGEGRPYQVELALE